MTQLSTSPSSPPQPGTVGFPLPSPGNMAENCRERGEQQGPGRHPRHISQADRSAQLNLSCPM